MSAKSLPSLHLALPADLLKSVKQYRKKSLVVAAHTPANYLYQIEEGLIKLERTMPGGVPVILGVVNSDDWLGVPSLLNGQPYRFDAVCLTDCTLKRVPIYQVRQLLPHHSGLYEWLAVRMSKRLRMVEKSHYLLSVRSSRGRVLQFILNWAEEHGQKVGFETLIRPIPSQSEVGLLTNTSRQSVATVFNELRRAGIIHYTRRYLIVRQIDRLQALLRSVT